MHYIKLPFLDEAVSFFDICQAHQQLESDYNVGGILIERPSNRRRNASTGVQLSRMKYHDVRRWVDICAKEEDASSDDEAVRDIYLMNVLQYGLPMNAEMREFISKRYVAEFLEKFPSWTSPAPRPSNSRAEI